MSNNPHIAFVHDLNNQLTIAIGKVDKAIRMEADPATKVELEKSRAALLKAVELAKEYRRSLPET